ncbi:integrase, partial [Rhizobium sp. YS-1r]
RLTDKQACKTMVEILALAHERTCERELAERLASMLDAGELPDMAELRKHFAPDPATLPVVSVHLAPLSGYEALVAGHAGERA